MIDAPPILITGCPRSGASLIAFVINICGAYAGGVSVNEMYTNVDIKNTLVKPYLDRMGADPEGQFPLPDSFGITIPLDWKERVEAIIESQGYVDGQWMYKDSRSALIWPLWNNSFPNAKWLIVRRRTADVIESCKQTAHMSAFKNQKNWQATKSRTEFAAWLWYVHQYELKFVEMINNGLNCKIIWPERMLNKDYKQIHEVIEWLGLEWKDEALDPINILLWGNPVKERRKI